MKKKWNFGRLFRYGLMAVAVIFVVIQLVPVKRSNPPIKSEPVWDARMNS